MQMCMLFQHDGYPLSGMSVNGAPPLALIRWMVSASEQTLVQEVVGDLDLWRFVERADGYDEYGVIDLCSVVRRVPMEGLSTAGQRGARVFVRNTHILM